MSPAPASPKRPFSAVIENAAPSYAAYKNSPEYALDLGIAPDEIISIARGEGCISGLCAQSPWVLGRIAALVRAARTPNSLGSQILASTHTDPYAWGIKSTGDRDRDLALLLNLVE